mgnify:CR=1 FL=1
MRNRFDRQLEQLNNELINMGSLIEEAIEMAITALMKQDAKKAKEIVDFDEEIDEKEREIESLCLKLLLQQQPVAKDLRQISAALKMITDMERIGDHAADISEMTILMAGTPYIRNIEHLQTMAKEAMVMLVKSIEAYVEKDLAKAEKVIESDDVIDDLFDQIKAELIDAIHQNPENGEQAADLLMVSKYLERIGDHATDISELAIVLSEKTYVKKLDHIEEMARETMVMLIQSLEAYVEKDLDKAQKVIAHDDVIDDLFEEVKQELIELIRNHADEGEQAVDLLMVTKYFERIGDHATNIAEWVIFSITGQIAG